MFVFEPARLSRRYVLIAGSAALHVIALLFWLWAPETFFLLPQIAPRAKSGPVIPILSPVVLRPESVKAAAVHQKGAPRVKKSHPMLSRVKPEPEIPKPALPDASDLGPVLKVSRLWLIPSIHEVKLALPEVAPLPGIARSELPNDFEGDIVVEITIAKDGKVVRTKVLQTIGNGLENKVVATLMNWRFKPASFDGVPVASLQDISFHYPENAHP